MSQDQLDKNWVDTSASMAPAVLGAAAGMIVGDLIHKEARRPVAFTLAALGVAVLVPSAVGFVAGLIVGPESRHGSRKTLQSIRDAGVGRTEFAEIDEEEMFVG